MVMPTMYLTYLASDNNQGLPCLIRSDEDFIVFWIPTISAGSPYAERNRSTHTGVVHFDEKRLGEMEEVGGIWIDEMLMYVHVAWSSHVIIKT